MTMKWIPKLQGQSPWFEIYRLNDQTYAFKEPHHEEEVICYLIMGQHQAILFDTGMGIADIRAEVRAITPLPIVVVNSHCHYDHIGGNHLFEEIWSFKHPFENNRIERGYTNEECMTYLTEGSYNNLPASVDLTTFSVKGTRITKYLHAGDRIELGGRTLTVYPTPGETPGAISLYDDLHHIFFTGDLLHPGGMWLHQKESSWHSFIQSIHFLQSWSHPLQHLSPAHNEYFVDPGFIDKVKQGIAAVENHTNQGVLKAAFLAFPFEGFSFYLPRDHNN
jgi:glyoxylase-like metal-dependent hydrolase (beta-lactamase superfamily II)